MGSEVFVWHSSRGDSTVVDMALPGAEAKLIALFEQIAQEIAEARSPLGGSTTRWCYEAGEFRRDAHLRPEPLALADAYGSYYRDGVNHSELYHLNVPLIFRRIVNGTRDFMDVHITEEDRNDTFGFNLDDDCGTKRLTWQSNGVTLIHPNNYPPGDTDDCHGADLGKSDPLEVSYKWTPKYSY